ncbi:SMC-Scp complex subunit ScpB [Archaeoglobus sp.]
MELKKIIEAILFSSSEPVKVSELARITGKDKIEILNILSDLIKDYSSRDTSIEIIKVGEKFLMRVKPQYAEYVEKFTVREFDRGTLRTLAVIAIKQPVTLAKVAKIRGNKCYDHVKKLVERGLVKAEKKGRSTILTTTEEFATYFGLESSEPEKIKEALKKYFEDDERP